MDDFTAYTAFGSLVYTAVQFVKMLQNQAWTSAMNQASAWVIGILVTCLAAQTSFADGIPTLGDSSLSVASGWDQVFIGLTVAGVAGVVFSLKRAVDNRDTDVVAPAAD